MPVPARAVTLRRTARVLAAAAFALAMPAVTSAQLVINEIDYDQPSTDTAEFIEIKNADSAAVNLDGYAVVLVNGNGGGALVYQTIELPSVSLPAGGYFVVCANAANTVNCNLDVTTNTDLIQNGAPDAVALVLGTTIVDAVSYEGNTGAPYTEGSGSGLEDNPATAFLGLSRFPDGGDTNQNNIDLSPRCITPGAANATASTNCAAPGNPVLVINEIDYDQPGTDSAEFIELKNAGAVAVNLDLYAIQLVNGSGGGAVVYQTFDLPALVLPPGGFFVLCGNAATTLHCNLDVSPETDLVQNGAPDAVALVLGTTIVDTVSYEGNTGAPFTEGSGVGLEDLGTTGSDFLGISRFPDGSDTNQNNVDLSPRCITPGSANMAANSGCSTPADPVLVINEIDYDQPGTDAAEFVEIKNAGTAAVNLDPYALRLVNGAGTVVYQTIDLPAVVLAPGSYFVICANAANTVSCDLDVEPDTNLIQNGAPDAVALVLGATIVDTVSYEGDTGAPYTEGSGAGLVDDGSGAFVGLARFPDGMDTNRNNLDLSPRCITPGAPNTVASAGCTQPVRTPVVVNEVDYDQPGLDSAEFIELKNVSGAAVDLDAYAIRLVNGSAAPGVVYQVIDLPAVLLAPGAYYVICANAATVAHCDLDVPSVETDLIQNGSPDAVALVLAGAIVDTVSYEGNTSPPYTEGSGVGLEDAGTAGNDFRAISRFPDGSDTDVNNIDFSPRCITPGGANTIFATNCTATGPVFEIFEIQGTGPASPFPGGVVTTKDNVVTALASDGFFIQTPEGRSDGNVNTSDGIFVFTGAPPAVAVGDQVDVSGTVIEFFDFTEIGGGPRVSVDSVGNPLPAPVLFNATVPSPDPTAPSCAIEFECYEGMRIKIVGGTVAGPNQRFGTDPIAEVHVVAGPVRAFREPGILRPGLPGLPVWDGNPEVFELDPDRLGLPNQIIPAGSHFDAEGILGFEFGGYELWPTSLTVTAAVLPRPVSARQHGEFTVGSLNLFRLFDDVNDPGDQDNDAVVSSAEYARRLAKFSRYIRQVLGSPDILAVEEAEKIDVLEALAARIGADDPSVSYSAHLIEGNDVGGIDSGFLVRDTVVVDAVTQLGATETLSVDGSLLHDRPPLLLEGQYVGHGAGFAISVLNVHNRSLGGIEDPGPAGARVRQKRLEQAQSIAQKAQDIQTADPAVHLVVIGDFNAFEFTDGYVDAVGQIAGDFNPADNERSGTDLVNPNLTKRTLTVPAAERYSFNFGGSAQAIDHALTSRGLDPLIRRLEYGRGNPDAAVDLINDASTPLRSSDHDGQVLFIFADSDHDGVADEDDACAGTVIPEGVPTVALAVNHYALVNGDGIFDTTAPPGRGKGPDDVFTLDDTAGCSCEQIIAARQLGAGHERFGCSIGVMRDWVESVGP
jgi:predicted extracellular nuclease